MRLDVSGLAKIYGKKRGLLPATFRVRSGELVAVVGHNGAGKSTLLKLLGGWILPDRGRVSCGGIDIKDRRTFIKNVGFVPETPNLFDFFSVEYNLRLFAGLFRAPSHRIEKVLKEFDLLPYRKNRVGILSKGLKQRVNICRALLADPPVMLLDEPTAGLDFEMTKEVHSLLKKIHSLKKTIMFTSHRPEEIKTLATRMIVLHNGKMVFDGSPKKYFRSKAYRELYL